MKRREEFGDGLPNALELYPQILYFWDRAFVSDFFGPLSSATHAEHPDEEVLRFLLANAGRYDLLLVGGLFGGCRGLSEGIVNGVDDEG